MKKFKKVLRITAKVLAWVVFLFSTLMFKGVFATSLESTKLVTGTQSLVNVIISWLTGIGITVCGGYFIYYVYCLKTNDEGERRRNIQNIKTTLICMVLITCGLALIDTILGFYK